MINWFDLAMGITGGLIIFLLGVDRLSFAFSQLGDDRIRRWIDRFTSNVFTGILTGTVACTVLDSSSATIIMVIAMIRGGLLTFEQSLGLVMGANIGTTIGAQIIALDIFGYAPIFLLVGFLLYVLGGKSKYHFFGIGLLGAGLIFFGLGYLKSAVEPLKDHESLIASLEAFGQTPVWGSLAGCLATCVMQSSSATVGIVIVLAKAGLLTTRAGVAIMLGAEIGTVSNTVVASFGRGREALRCAAFHFFFNATTVVAGVLLIDQLIWLATRITPVQENDPGYVARILANSQVLFNVIGVAAFFPFIPKIAAFLQRLIPPKPSDTPSDSEVTQDE